MTEDKKNEYNYLPKHLSIIMDGNGRWAKANGKERIYGHQKGVETVRKIVEESAKIGIEYLSLFAFSTENWNRPQTEVDALMELLVLAIEKELPDLHKNNIKLIAFGDIERLPEKCKLSISSSMLKTQNNTGMSLCIALSYSGRWDILQAVNKISLEIENSKIKAGSLNEDLFAKYLVTNNFPDPELLIRTSGETRISNFYLWQTAYTELYFTNKFWPEFEEDDLHTALQDFQKRERRFGKISEQLKNNQ